MSILVKNNIHWVGQRDWEVRDFHGTEYKTLRGSVTIQPGAIDSKFM